MVIMTTENNNWNTYYGNMDLNDTDKDRSNNSNNYKHEVIFSNTQ